MQQLIRRMHCARYARAVLGNVKLLFQFLIFSDSQMERLYMVTLESVVILLPESFLFSPDKIIILFLSSAVVVIQQLKFLKLRRKSLAVEPVRDEDVVLRIKDLLVVVLSVDIDPVRAELPDLPESHHLAVQLGDGFA